MPVKKGPPDVVMFLTVVLLISIGLLMIFSASAYTSNSEFGDPLFFVKKQMLWVLLAFVGLLVAFKIPYLWLRKLGVAAMIFSILSLIVLMIPGVGREVSGSVRQINLGFASFSPSEMSKLCTVIFLASSLSNNLDSIKKFLGGLLPYLVLIGVICGLVMMQPDLGTTFAIALTAVLMLAMAGARMSHLVLLALVGAALIVSAIVLEPYRLIRFTAFLDPWKYASGAGFQTIQSLYALGSGGLFGMGLGQGRQKFFYLPEQHTDFIFAILGEELGYIGIMLVLLLFAVFAWRGFRIALKVPDNFSSLLAAGLTTMIISQAIINMGVVGGLLPVTGIPLPFISYGGSSLLFIMAAVGILLNLSRYVQHR